MPAAPLARVMASVNARLMMLFMSGKPDPYLLPRGGAPLQLGSIVKVPDLLMIRSISSAIAESSVVRFKTTFLADVSTARERSVLVAAEAGAVL